MGEQGAGCQTAVELCERNLNGPRLQDQHDGEKMTHGERAKLKHSQRCKSLKQRMGIYESKSWRGSRGMGDIKRKESGPDVQAPDCEASTGSTGA